MENKRKPVWANDKNKINRPRIDRWYAPDDHGDLLGTIIWRGEMDSVIKGRQMTYVLRTTDGLNIAVREWARLQALRLVPNGEQVYLEFRGFEVISNGNEVRNFNVYREQEGSAA